jgi:hypothetical protein
MNVSGHGLVKMYYFAIDFGRENALPSSTASGLGSASVIFENQQLANSNWQLAKFTTATEGHAFPPRWSEMG